MIKLNGENLSCETPVTVAELLAAQGFSTRFIAVEKNGEIVPRATYDSCPVAEGDVIEVVRLVGGG